MFSFLKYSSGQEWEEVEDENCYFNIFFMLIELKKK